MKKIIIIIVFVLIIGGLGFWFFVLQKEDAGENGSPPSFLEQTPEIQLSEQTPMPEAKNKRAALIIAFKDFQDQEYFDTREVLESRGVEITTFSTSPGTAIGKFGNEIEVDKKLEELGVENFDAIVFIGGPGAFDYIDDSRCHQIAKEAVSQNKVLGAICIAPAILAKAGVLQGKKATVWTSSLDKSAAKILKENGAIFQDQDVVVDGKIITASGPTAAKKFGQAIVAQLK